MTDTSAGDSSGEGLDAVELVQQLAPSFALTQLEKVVYPENGLRKAELVAYYAAVADWLLPHMAKRPLVLLRCPEGRRKSCFLQKQLAAGAPDAIGRTTIRDARGDGIYGFIQDLEGLVALAELGAIEIHTWACHVNKIETPDLLVFALEPDPELAFERVGEAALALREQLAVLGLESFVKSSGGGGLHVVAPVQPGHGWDAHNAFAQGVVAAMAKAEPERFVTKGRKAARAGKILLDCSGNVRGASTLAPYSPRAGEGVLIAMPLTWEELAQGVRPEQFDVRGVIHRLEGNASDPWQGFWELSQALPSDSLRKRLAVA